MIVHVADRTVADEKEIELAALGGPGVGENGVDVGLGGERTFDIDAPVAGRDGLELGHAQMISKYRASCQSLMCLRLSRSSHSRVAA